MKKLSSILLIGILAITFGCTKDNPTITPNNGGGISPTSNSAPTCSITIPQNGATFTYDENINVSVFAEDSDGTIAEVSLYIDNVGYQNMTTFPYNFTIVSGVMSPGNHTIKAIAKDNEGSNGESSVTITIQQPATESPDFVSFPDGRIPPTWQTASWYVDNTGGYDDIYSLKVVSSGSVMTTKTIQGNGYLEFYVKGNVSFNYIPWSNEENYPYLKLYIDGSTYFYYTTETLGSWEKYIVDLDAGTHTILWEYFADNNYDYCNIDAIKFTHNSSNPRIGSSFQGGYVGYLDNTRQHGHIISENDLGLYNLSDAINACNNYSIGQYSDWRLPNIGELRIILTGLGRMQSPLMAPVSTDFYAICYWSSSSQIAFRMNNGGIQYGDLDSSIECNVRAIRSF